MWGKSFLWGESVLMGGGMLFSDSFPYCITFSLCIRILSFLDQSLCIVLMVGSGVRGMIVISV